MKARLKKLSNDIPPEEIPESLNEELYGSDSVSVEITEASKLEFGFSFSAQDGELGNESDDFGDLPETLKKPGHIYDPVLSAGRLTRKNDTNEITDAMHIVDEDDIGLSYEEDSYTKDDDPRSEDRNQ